MNYEASVRYLLSLGLELAAPTQAAAAKFDLENITVLAERLRRPDIASHIRPPLVPILSPIDCRHQNFIRCSLAHLPRAQAGILKPGVPLILADQLAEAVEVILARAKRLGFEVIEPTESFRADRQSL